MPTPFDPTKRQVAFYIDAGDLEAIQRIAFTSGRSQSEVLRAAVKSYIGTGELNNTVDALRAAAIAIDKALAIETIKAAPAQDDARPSTPVWA